MAADFLGRGPNFPPFGGTGGAWRLDDGEGKIRQSLRLILATAPGERVMRPDFGCGIHDLVFEPDTPMLRALLAERIRSAVLRFEPRVDLIDLLITSDRTGPTYLRIELRYRLRANNALGNLVYPFYLEGTSPAATAAGPGWAT